jgi:cell shape-determining protein MreC
VKAKLTWSRRTLLAVLVVGAATMTVLGRGFAARVRGVAQTLLAPAGDGGMYLVTALRRRVGRLGGRGLSAEEARRLAQRRERLRRTVARLQREAARYKRQARAAKHFTRHYSPEEDLRCELIAAEVVGAGGLPYGQTRVLAVRRDEGAVPGALVTTRQIVHDRSQALPPKLAVVNAASLVGRLTEESRAFTARVHLLTDRSFRVKARIRRRIDPNRPRTIKRLGPKAAEVLLTPANNAPVDAMAFGNGADGLVLPDVAALESIRPGDWVMTYPDGVFAEIELHIGRVSRVVPNPDNQRFVTVHARPAADLSALREVFVLHPHLLRERDAR